MVVTKKDQKNYLKDIFTSILHYQNQSKQKFKDGLKNEEVYKAFERLKKALTSDQLLVYPDFEQPFIEQLFNQFWSNE